MGVKDHVYFSKFLMFEITVHILERGRNREILLYSYNLCEVTISLNSSVVFLGGMWSINADGFDFHPKL